MRSVASRIFEKNDVGDAPFREARDQGRLEQLHDSDGNQDQLLVDFPTRRKRGQAGEKQQPDGVEAVEPPRFRVGDGRRGDHAAFIQS